MDHVRRSQGVYSSSPQSVIVILLEVRPDREPKASTFLTTSSPSFTLPKTTCFPSSLREQRGDLLLPTDADPVQDDTTVIVILLFEAKVFTSSTRNFTPSTLEKPSEQEFKNNWTQLKPCRSKIGITYYKNIFI